METSKIVLWGVIVFILLLLVFSTLGFRITKTSGSGFSSDMPEKCRLPTGQDVASWKEHLGHHTETQECLKYYD